MLIGTGMWAFRQLKVQAYPEISDTQVVVITLFPGHAAEEVELQVTVPIERALNSTPNVIARRSRTLFGLSVVELTFDYGTNDYFARQVVLEKLRDAQLPNNVSLTLGPLSTPIGELYRYTLSGERYSVADLRELEDWVVEPRFLQVSGVADVTPFGGLIKQSLEVKLVSSQSGRDDSGTNPYGPNRNEVFVPLHPYDSWQKGKVKADLVEEFAARLEAAGPVVAEHFF